MPAATTAAAKMTKPTTAVTAVTARGDRESESEQRASHAVSYSKPRATRMCAATCGRALRARHAVVADSRADQRDGTSGRSHDENTIRVSSSSRIGGGVVIRPRSVSSPSSCLGVRSLMQTRIDRLLQSCSPICIIVIFEACGAHPAGPTLLQPRFRRGNRRRRSAGSQ